MEPEPSLAVTFHYSKKRRYDEAFTMAQRLIERTKGLEIMLRPLFLALVVTFFAQSFSSPADAAPKRSALPRLLSMSPEQAAALPPAVVKHIKEAERAFILAAYHLEQAERLSPGVTGRVADGDAGVAPSPFALPPRRLSPIEGRRLPFAKRATPSRDSTRKGTRKGARFLGFGKAKPKKPKTDEELADEQRKEMDPNYRRGTEGSKWFGKLLKGVREITGKFLPKGMNKLIAPGAEQVHQAADKVGKQVSAPKDGMAIIDGKLRCWNKKTKRWEEF